MHLKNQSMSPAVIKYTKVEELIEELVSKGVSLRWDAPL